MIKRVLKSPLKCVTSCNNTDEDLDNRRTPYCSILLYCFLFFTCFIINPVLSLQIETAIEGNWCKTSRFFLTRSLWAIKLWTRKEIPHLLNNSSRVSAWLCMPVSTHSDHEMVHDFVFSLLRGLDLIFLSVKSLKQITNIQNVRIKAFCFPLQKQPVVWQGQINGKPSEVQEYNTVILKLKSWKSFYQQFRSFCYMPRLNEPN